ncbi:MAG: hypothetical protein GY856_25265, partial [bacterium]|nr:hypothetical protein [bacterium]
MKRAITLQDVKKTLTPRPLTAEELDEFFVETSDVRDRFVSRRDEIFERLGAKPGAKVLLAGHAGSGKSTELVKLREEHAGELLFADFSIIEEGDPGNVRVESLLVLVVEAILRLAAQQKLELEDKTLASIYGWFNETFEVRESELRYTGAAGAGIDTGDSVWGKLLGLTAFLKADIRTGSGVLNKTIIRDDRRLSQLAYQCGLLIKEAQLAIGRAAGKELVLLIEDLDKVTVAEADALFIENPSPLAGLPCKAIFTAPIFLLCNPRAVVLESYFEVVTLPMIKLRQPDGSRF